MWISALAYSLPLPELVASGEISLTFHSILYTGSNMEGSHLVPRPSLEG